MLINEPKKGKFSPAYTGPHKVLELLEEGKNVKITYKNGTRVVHPNKLRRARMTNPEAESESSSRPSDQ